ncbi:MAG: biotin transporter BioY [Coriobacteriaceae bacterium]|nr:biotin transporter BioY [Coriobacteriaceae bacterium]
MNAQRIARAGVMVALLAVSAQVMLPVGPVPFTLQTLVLAMIPALLDRSTAILAITAYVLLGALGLPVFSGFGAGAGALLGPTGGFLWGFVLGVVLASCLYMAAPQRMGAYVRSLLAAALMLLVSYVCGTVQLMVLMSLDLAQALAIAVIPFVIPDAIKIAIGARLGCTIGRVLAK